MAIYDVYVVGMRKELFVDNMPGCDYFDEVPGENERHILFCTTAEGRIKFTITLWTSYGWCGSGYTTASWGNISYRDVYGNNFGPATHFPKDHKILLEGAKYDASKSSIDEALIFDNSVEPDEDEYPYEYDCKTNIFTVSYDGDDSYYPAGYANVKEELFTELPRAMKNRPVWILNGASGTGKSTFGYIFDKEGCKVYETDSAKDGILPDEIWADVIVVGNKWKNITVDEVKKHLPDDVNAIDVTFSFSM